ncbi:HypC/HybG/HupF family hydrogenase formation chaperone [Candidatus Woesearchaeota archaeon]|nr:HypC/HybG/HupF family hydrogenase formation chaperone [Candidatus Woesearchaeota archaeon]MDP1694206.1 HypC/HybG/HupF family hydrogenase formation chaperone [Candidatus Woesearchaeota archaeon]
MCLAIPGKIIKIEDDDAIVDYISEKRVGKIVEGTYKVGDYVIIQGGLVIEQIPEEQAKKWLKALPK